MEVAVFPISITEDMKVDVILRLDSFLVKPHP
jgi:hypothetical protein